MKLNIKLISRNLLKNKSHTVLNIIGLSIGFACFFSVIVWVKNEFSYDRQLPNAARTYRLTFETTRSGNTLHFARCWEKWIAQLPGVFPQIEELVRLEPYRHTALKIGESKFYTDRVFATDSNFFKVFGIGLSYGDVQNVLNKPYSAVISLSMSKKCFGNTDAIGKTLLMSGEYDTKMIPFTITGIMNDSPKNSHIHFDVVTSFTNPMKSPSWAYVYLLLKTGTTPDQILTGLPAFIKQVEKEDSQNVFRPFLQNITDIHLYSDKDREVEANGNISNIYLFIAAALILLLVSWVNYYNLNKARMLTLQKQIQIQRIAGSDTLPIVQQTAIESAVCVFLALLLSGILLDTFGQPSESVSGFTIFPEGIKNLIGIWPYILIIIVFSIAAGSLPVIVYALKTNRSIKVFKEPLEQKTTRFVSYGILITVQFLLSIVLLVAALTINQQKKLLLSNALGKMSSDILVFKKQNWEIRFKYQTFREQALQNPYIKSFTASMEEPTGETVDAMQVESSALDDMHKDIPVYVLSVEDNFLDFFGIPLSAGRNFSTFNPDRKGEDYILNESAVKLLGWTPEEAIGRPFKMKFSEPGIFYGGTVVGVVKDFYFTTLKKEIKPYAFFQKPIFYLCFLVEVIPDKKEEAISALKAIWEKELPEYPFQYEFLSDLYQSSYKKELTQAKLTSFFSMLAIVVICFGLFSVTSVLVSRRTKEIGIRKVNGAKVLNIMTMLNYDFIKCYIIALIIACPVAWFTMQKWLQNFAYRAEMSWWIFALAGVAVLLVTVLTVSLQSLRTAMRNPVEALRYE